MLRKLKQAAEFIGLHEKTLQERARAGKIPGAYKPGRAWMFPEEGLLAYRNSLAPCPYIASEPSGTSTSRVNEVALDALLKLPTRRRPRSSTTASSRNSGSRTSSERSRH